MFNYPRTRTTRPIRTVGITEPLTCNTWDVQKMASRSRQVLAVWGYVNEMNCPCNRNFFLIKLIEIYTVISEHLIHIATHPEDIGDIIFSKNGRIATKESPTTDVSRISKIGTFYWVNSEYDVYQWSFRACNFDVFSIALQNVRSLPYGEVLSCASYQIPQWLLNTPTIGSPYVNSLDLTIVFNTISNTLEITINDLLLSSKVMVAASWCDDYKLIIYLHKVNQQINLTGFTAFNVD